MFDSVNHLPVSYGKKRLAFIGGPEASEETAIRFNAYKEALLSMRDCMAFVAMQELERKGIKIPDLYCKFNLNRKFPD